MTLPTTEDLQRFIQAWRTRQQPKFDGQYDSLLPIFQVDGEFIDVQLLVSWNPEIGDYQATPVRLIHTEAWVPTDLTLQAAEHERLTKVLLPPYGITKFQRLTAQGPIVVQRRSNLPNCCRPKQVQDQR